MEKPYEPDQRPPEPDEAKSRETSEWLEAFDQVAKEGGRGRAEELFEKILSHAAGQGIVIPGAVHSPYLNTISPQQEPPYPGDLELERRIGAIVRWNAAVMVLRADHRVPNLGGHLATYASASTLFEVGFNHFFRGREGDRAGDQIYFQGHASPGVYARAFVEGRLGEEHLDRFRQETADKGLPSYPHPWLLPDFWEFPSVSMGLAPLQAVYQARFNRYLEHRGIKDTGGSRVWAFVGDGECDEPESVGALTLAAREGLDNLVFVVNCNLQRLDGPVRGNGKVIQEIEALFRGAGWNVIKVIWGRDWDPLLAADSSGLLRRRMEEAVDGDYQKYVVEPGAYTRKHFFGKYPEVAKLVESLSDDKIRRLRRGGHDAVKVYAAYHRAANAPGGKPTVILAKTVKGWSLGESAEGRNVAHQVKKFREGELRKFRDRLGLPIPDERLSDPPYYRPDSDSPEMRYLLDRRRALGGPVPRRIVRAEKQPVPDLREFSSLLEGFKDEVSTTKAYSRLLTILLRDPRIGRRVVPIIPDEARTFGLDPLFRKYGIYSPRGQLYSPVDVDLVIAYREARDGQILEEGITEAGSAGSFIAAGTSYATHAEVMVPFYSFYSMFGFQRTGDLFWAAADARAKGFLLGATAGRTTLAGEGLQHADGHSPLLMSVIPTCRSYDPAYAYELAVIIHEGLRRMVAEGETCFYYLTLYNEPYVHPPMPEGIQEGILKGLYRFSASEPESRDRRRVQLLGSGTILREVLRARVLLEEKFGVAADVWSATSYTELRRDALDVDRWNLLHPGEVRRVPYLLKQLESTQGPVIAATDYMRSVPDQIAPWLPGRWRSLGTDGFGRSDGRAELRRHFEIDAEHIAYAALDRLAEHGTFPRDDLRRAIPALGIDPAKPNPATI